MVKLTLLVPLCDQTNAEPLVVLKGGSRGAPIKPPLAANTKVPKTLFEVGVPEESPIFVVAVPAEIIAVVT